MRKIYLVLLSASVMVWSAAAQVPVGTQAAGSASAGTAVQADKQGAQAGAEASVSVRQETKAGKSSQEEESRAQARSESRGSAQASSQAGGGSAMLESGTTIDAVLHKTVDARKAKPGDRVEARNRKDVKSEGQVVIPKGAKLLGHVTQAQARGRGETESSLGIMFDRAVLKDGSEVPLEVAIQAVAAARTVAAAPPPEMPAPARAGNAAPAGGGLLGGVGSSVSATTGVAGGVAGSAGDVAGGVGSTATGALGAGADPALGERSGGVVGIPGLRLESAASSQTSGQVLTSSTGTVRLESGTQLLLKVASQP